MKRELNEHGYDISAGTLYPILHSMENKGLLNRTEKEKKVEGQRRKYDSATQTGEEILQEAREKAFEFYQETQ